MKEVRRRNESSEKTTRIDLESNRSKRQAFGTLFLIPPTILFKRKEVGCLSIGDMFKIFMLALLGRTLVLIAYSLGVKYTSAVSGVDAFNALPITTFLFALLLRYYF
ncbi:WAT1-related protein [Cucumis melo var. makuwa]|uniref:WAT1-related protein n=1 Tax=Cucumis melo var. makuwa TaxID=1194695 RepID=A0A5D3CNP3_CUCMM|nr:WAT1-related protein [Cucumis melo var. makuwa]